MLCFLNMGVNCSYLQRNIFSQASIQFSKNMYYTFKMPKQEIIVYRHVEHCVGMVKTMRLSISENVTIH